MKFSTIFKRALYTMVLVLLLTPVRAQSRDSLVYFFKDNGSSLLLVDSLHKADFVRIIPPFTLQDNFVEIKEFYKNGVTKFVGKAIASTISLTKGYADYEGTCISFYSTGNRRFIMNYKEGSKNGLQYFYFPEGKLYMVVNNFFKQNFTLNGSKIVDVYDRSGIQICKEGNGISIDYDKDYNELSRGTVKNGYKDGEWHGEIKSGTVGKYTIFYKKNVFLSGIGYETATGKFYPFKSAYMPALPSVSLVNFITKVKKHITLPKGTSVTQEMIDSTRINFTIENDGHLTHLETITSVPNELMEALKTAFAQCAGWKPTKIYGIPAQAQVSLSFNIQAPQRNNSYNKSVENYQILLYKDTPINSLPSLSTVL
jgi:hypothetical protein